MRAEFMPAGQMVARISEKVFPSLERCRELQKAFSLITRADGAATPETTEAAAMALRTIWHETSFKESRPDLVRERDIDAVFFGFVQWLVWYGARMEAATCLWPAVLFTAEPRSVRMIWAALDGNDFVSLLGASGQGKSFSPLVYFLLEWLADPTGTRVDLVSTEEEKLKSAVYAKLVQLHQGASLRLPGECKAMTVSLDAKAGFGFFCRLIKRGEVNGGELKGAHRTGRESPHPIYGASTRRFVLVDEAQQVSDNVFPQIPNVLASRSSDGSGSVKVVLTANPTDMASQYGVNCEPVEGWDAVLMLDGGKETWRSRTGAACVRLDVRQSENYKQRREVFANFQTWDGAQGMLAQCGGDENHPDMWTYVYGMFPPSGPMASLIPARWMALAEGEWLFDTITTPLAGCDVALTGDAPTLAYGRAGRAAAWRSWSGEEMKLPEPKTAVQLDGVATLPHGDTQEVADAYMARLKQLGITPECCAVDFTGMPGVGDVMRHQWRAKVGQVAGQEGMTGPVDLLRVVYSEKASTRKIGAEDSKTPEEMFTNRATELWFRAAKFYELGLVRHGRGVPLDAAKQLTTRKSGRSSTDGKKQKIEPKEEHKRRLKGKSPDDADAVTLLLDAASQAISALVVKAKDTVLPKLNATDFGPMEIDRNGFQSRPVEIEGFEAGGDVETLRDNPETQQAGARKFPDGVPWEW